MAGTRSPWLICDNPVENIPYLGQKDEPPRDFGALWLVYLAYSVRSPALVWQTVELERLGALIIRQGFSDPERVFFLGTAR